MLFNSTYIYAIIYTIINGMYVHVYAYIYYVPIHHIIYNSKPMLIEI